MCKNILYFLVFMITMSGCAITGRGGNSVETDGGPGVLINQTTHQEGISPDYPKDFPPSVRASMCITRMGSCQLINNVPVAYPCICITPNGQIQGFAK